MVLMMNGTSIPVFAKDSHLSWRRVASLWAEIRHVLWDLFVSSGWRRVAFFLLPYAGVIAGMDVAAHYGDTTDAMLPVQLYLSQDGSFGEYLEYALSFAMAVMLFLLWRRTDTGLYLVNAALFVYLTADNALEFHEAFGHWSAAAMPQGLPLPPNDLGEILLFAVIGTLWCASLGIALAQAQTRPAVHGLILAAGVAGAAFFGVFADAVTSWGEKSAALISLEAWIEDLGEFAMLILTFLACCAIFETVRRDGGREVAG